MAAALAMSSAFAAGSFGRVDIHEAVDDHTVVDPTLPDPESAENGRGYNVNIGLDEAYIDYQDRDLLAHQRYQQILEEAEVAAFEFGPSATEVQLPPELIPLDRWPSIQRRRRAVFPGRRPQGTARRPERSYGGVLREADRLNGAVPAD